MLDLLLDVRGVHYWAWIALFYLILLTYQDYKNKRMVDDRKNWVMLGVTISLISHIPINIIYLLTLIAVVICLRIYLLKFNLVGEADVTALNWIFLGFGYLNPIFLLGFVIIFIVTTLLYMGLKLYVFKYKQPTPFFSVILVTFWFTSYMFGLF